MMWFVYAHAYYICNVAPWDANNFSPRSRELSPVAIYKKSPADPADPAPAAAPIFPLTLTGTGAYVVLDFGKNVAGFTTLTFGSVSGGSQGVGLAYSESTDYAVCPSAAVGACADGDGQAGAGDHSNGGHGPDGTLSVPTPIAAHSTFTPPTAHLRGGFRYLNIFLRNADENTAAAGGNSTAASSSASASASVELANVTLRFTAAPLMGADPSAYKGHFHSSDDLINQIWYGCAYTVQLCTIDPEHGRQWPAPDAGWNNGVKIGLGSSIIVDGAKRDRTIWPGDMGVSSLTAFTTTGDTASARASLDTLYALQDAATGQLPYVGPEVFCQKPMGAACAAGDKGQYNSDTYHLWALSATASTFKFLGAAEGRAWMLGSNRSTGSNAVMKVMMTGAGSSASAGVGSGVGGVGGGGGGGGGGIWAQYKRGVAASLAKVSGPRHLMRVDAKADWQRGGQGGENIAANALLCGVLSDAATLAAQLGDRAAAAQFAAERDALKAAINRGGALAFWDEAAGAYRDNTMTAAGKELHPQDGNAIAVWMNVTDPPSRRERVLAHLRSNWQTRGAVSPEWSYEGKEAIGNFPGSMEVSAHLSAGGPNHTARGLDLIRRQWGYQLSCANSTQSTFWEGYQADGQYAFQGIYMSHAHGWAAGPASALSLYVLGVRPLPPATTTAATETTTTATTSYIHRYAVVPQPSLPTLSWVNGSMPLAGGGVRAEAAWEAGEDGRFGLTLAVESPTDSSDTIRATSVGYVGLPLLAGLTPKTAEVTVSAASCSFLAPAPVAAPVQLSAGAAAGDGDELRDLPDGGMARVWYRFETPPAPASGAGAGGGGSCRVCFDLAPKTTQGEE